jgi:hypothetical protein
MWEEASNVGRRMASSDEWRRLRSASAVAVAGRVGDKPLESPMATSLPFSPLHVGEWRGGLQAPRGGLSRIWESGSLQNRRLSPLICGSLCVPLSRLTVVHRLSGAWWAPLSAEHFSVEQAGCSNRKYAARSDCAGSTMSGHFNVMFPRILNSLKVGRKRMVPIQRRR